MIDFDTYTKINIRLGDLGKLIVAKGFKRCPKSGHTESDPIKLVY